MYTCACIVIDLHLVTIRMPPSIATNRFVYEYEKLASPAEQGASRLGPQPTSNLWVVSEFGFVVAIASFQTVLPWRA